MDIVLKREDKIRFMEALKAGKIDSDYLDSLLHEHIEGMTDEEIRAELARIRKARGTLI